MTLWEIRKLYQKLSLKMTRCTQGILAVLPTKKVHHILNTQKLGKIKFILNFDNETIYFLTKAVRLC